MSQEFPANGFKWKKNTSEFNADLIKNYDENSNKGYIFEVDVEYPKRFYNLYSNLPFLPEEWKLKMEHAYMQFAW